MATDTRKPARRRGRPIVPASDEDEALKARRQRNREAQLTFRRRRLAASQQQEQRTKRLEQIVEEMSTCFTRFTDEMLLHEALLRHEGLVSTLKGTMQEILSLAQEVVGADEEQEGSEPSKNQDKEQTVEHVDAVVDPALLSPPSLTGPSSADSHTSDSLDAFKDFSLVPRSSSIISDSSHGMSVVPFTNNATSMTALDPALIYFQQQSSVPRAIPPALAQDNRQYHNVYAPYSADALGLDASFYFDSFLPRLIQESLSKGYLLLQAVATTPPTAILNSTLHRAFGATLQVASRSEILERLQYVLGSGKDVQSKMYNIALTNVPADQLAAAALANGAGVDGDPADKFVNALAVSRRLLELGAKLLDPDTMELQILEPSPKPQRAINPIRLSSSRDYRQPPSWSYVDFFPAAQTSAPPKVATKVRVSVSLLINNLSSSAVCLEVGPGFPRHRLGQAVEASVIGVTNNEDASFSANIPIGVY